MESCSDRKLSERKKEKRSIQIQQILRTGGIHLWVRNRLSYKILQLTKSYHKVKL